jgi:hypothetical protein
MILNPSPCPGLELGGIEAGVGLGDPEADQVLAGQDGRDHPALLLLGAEQRDRLHAEDRAVDAGRGRHPAD